MSRMYFPRLPIEPPPRHEVHWACDWCEAEFFPTDLVFKLPTEEKVCSTCFDEYCVDLDRKERAEQLGVEWDWAGSVYGDT